MFRGKPLLSDLSCSCIQLCLSLVHAESNNHKQSQCSIQRPTQILLKRLKSYTIKLRSLSCQAVVELTQNDPEASTMEVAIKFIVH